MNFGRLNLNLLRVFDVICEERSVTAAGERLGLTQSAVSHALNQLRALFNDELFIRSGSVMIPTTRALKLGKKVHQAHLRMARSLQVRRGSNGDPGELFPNGRLISDHRHFRPYGTMAVCNRIL